MQIIYTSCVNELHDDVLDLSLCATPCRYRLIDSHAFREEKKLVLYESVNLPNVPYTAISYTWYGNEIDLDDPSSPLYWKDELGTFQVAGGEDGDPVSLDVLFHLCTISVRDFSSRFLWLDRLCIIQTSKLDKVWQISNMNTIYKTCRICCILPGGIRRLVRLEEETSWIHRGWTLQEAIVPKHTIVLFAWDHAMDGKNVEISGSFFPQDLIPGNSAYCELHDLLQSSIGFFKIEIDNVEIPVNIRIFGTSIYPSAALMDAIAAHIYHNDGDDKEHMYQCIWRSALLRTSSRPVDMVFSIMDVFGVCLNPIAFHKDDRLGATIALAREILKAGGKPNWIGATHALDPCSELSTFPQFPKTSVSGKAYMHLSDGSQKEVSEVMLSRRINSDRYLVGIPRGSMDQKGYLTLRAHTVRVSRQSSKLVNSPSISVECFPTNKPNVISAEDGSTWRIQNTEPIPHSNPVDPITYLVYIGREEQSASVAFARTRDLYSLKGWVVQEHSPNRFHRVAHLNISETFKGWIEDLPWVDLSIGGPLPLPSS